MRHHFFILGLLILLTAVPILVKSPIFCITLTLHNLEFVDKDNELQLNYIEKTLSEFNSLNKAHRFCEKLDWVKNITVINCYNILHVICNHIIGCNRKPLLSGETEKIWRWKAAFLVDKSKWHWPLLKGNASQLNTAVNPKCPICGEEPQNVEYWLQRCPNTVPLRQQLFGEPSPPLSVLTTNPVSVLALARKTLL